MGERFGLRPLRPRIGRSLRSDLGSQPFSPSRCTSGRCPKQRVTAPCCFEDRRRKTCRSDSVGSAPPRGFPTGLRPLRSHAAPSSDGYDFSHRDALASCSGGTLRTAWATAVVERPNRDKRPSPARSKPPLWQTTPATTPGGLWREYYHGFPADAKLFRTFCACCTTCTGCRTAVWRDEAQTRR